MAILFKVAMNFLVEAGDPDKTKTPAKFLRRDNWNGKWLLATNQTGCTVNFSEEEQLLQNIFDELRSYRPTTFKN